MSLENAIKNLETVKNSEVNHLKEIISSQQKELDIAKKELQQVQSSKNELGHVNSLQKH